MLDLIDGYDGSREAQGRLVAGIEATLAALAAAKGRGDRAQVARAETDVRRDPSYCIRFNDSGVATLTAAGRSYQAGRFEVPRLCELQSRALGARERAGRPPARARLFVFDGASPATDIGALQAIAPPLSMFQVASQFNCLESPGAFVTRIAEYFHDPTQGPRASISALPGTIIRHYAAPAPDGSRFEQSSDGPQLNLLADVADPGIATVHNGYLRSSDIADPPAFARALEERFDAIRVGVHDGVEVVLGGDWDGAVDGARHRTVAQVLTSTVAGGMYGDLDGGATSLTICRQLQRAAYLGTLLAAAALGKERVVLTLIGGGVFANPIDLIWETILWAADRITASLHRDLTIIVNGRNLGDNLPPDQLRMATRERAGALIRFHRTGATVADA